MASGWALELGDVTVRSGTGGAAHELVLEAWRGEASAWRVALDATGGHPELMPRMQHPEVVGALLLVRSDGEHCRGASAHEHRLHAIDPSGRVRWCHPWEAIGPILAGRRGLLIVARSPHLRPPADQPIAVAHQVRADDGEPLREWPIHLPPAAAAAVAAANWPFVRADLCLGGRRGRWEAVITASWRGGSATTRRRLKGA